MGERKPIQKFLTRSGLKQMFINDPPKNTPVSMAVSSIQERLRDV